MAERKAADAADLVRAVVAPRRTLFVDDARHKRGRECPPGTMVSLPAAEVAQLRRLGYLVDPDAAEIQVQDGSSVFPPPG